MEAPGYIATVVLAAIMIVANCGIAIVTVRAADGRLGRNELAGIRTTSTRASDDAWLAAHRAARVPTLWGCAASSLFALAGVPFGGHAVIFVVLLAASVIALTGGVIYGAWVGIRAAKATIATDTNR